MSVVRLLGLEPKNDQLVRYTNKHRPLRQPELTSQNLCSQLILFPPWKRVMSISRAYRNGDVGASRVGTLIAIAELARFEGKTLISKASFSHLCSKPPANARVSYSPAYTQPRPPHKPPWSRDRPPSSFARRALRRSIGETIIRNRQSLFSEAQCCASCAKLHPQPAQSNDV